MAQEPGWYPDPHDASRNLYWDGRKWHRNSGPSAPPIVQQQRKGCFGGFMKMMLLSIVGLVALGACIAAIGDSGTESGTSSSASSRSPSVASSPSSEVAEATASEDVPDMSTRDTSFLLVTKSQGLDKFFVDWKDAVDNAKALCLYYADDRSRFFERGVQEMQGLHPDMTVTQAAQFADAATQAYCPEFAR
jgi:hypothetical protein